MTALLFTAVYLKAGMGLDFVVMAAAASLLLVLAVIDIEHRLIPNRIVFPSLVVFLVVAPFWAELDMPRTFVIGSGMMASFLNSVASGTGAFLPYFAIWFVYPRGMGGGDPKLVGLIGLMVGYPAILVALWVGIVAGGAWAIALLALRRKGMKDAIPNVPFLSLGGITALLGGGEIIAEYQGLVDSLAGV
jgi:leader peptidase (prepilin peptidase)/N-methyltransferase